VPDLSATIEAMSILVCKSRLSFSSSITPDYICRMAKMSWTRNSDGTNLSIFALLHPLGVLALCTSVQVRLLVAISSFLLSDLSKANR
ncbi:MAG: hypothetical protein LBC41_18110, partial [Clostridiales bacterium]|nr:hypothetical protein [Clostridiales bacterium]